MRQTLGMLILSRQAVRVASASWQDMTRTESNVIILLVDKGKE